MSQDNQVSTRTTDICLSLLSVSEASGTRSLSALGDCDSKQSVLHIIHLNLSNLMSSIHWVLLECQGTVLSMELTKDDKSDLTSCTSGLGSSNRTKLIQQHGGSGKAGGTGISFILMIPHCF